MTVPYFSIVIPTYNREDFIGRTLTTIQSQTIDKWEVLIVDDGSQDNTVDVVRPFLFDSRFQYLPKENAERGAARNYGLARAQGDYVIFLDSDDLFHPNHLATLQAAIQAAPVPPNFIATKYDFERDGQRWPSDLVALPTDQLKFDTFLQGNPLACNICVRRANPDLKLFEEDRGYAAVEDWMFLLENTQYGDVVHLVDALTLTMNDHDQRSMRADNQGLIRRLDLASQWMQRRLSLTINQRRVLLGRVYYLCAIHAYADGHRTQALTYAWRASSGLSRIAAFSLFIRSLLGVEFVSLLKKAN
jgi:glycosyltransferase involved in cell wall biosynthesis